MQCWNISFVKHIRNDKAAKLLGKRILDLRIKQDISQEQLAFEAGVSRRQIGRIERGEINTGIATIFSIAKSLDVPVKTLFDF
jgi:transcriptional regulator with XRE-family HTH domain